jgi:arsenate reductase
MITIYHHPRCSKSRSAHALLIETLAGSEAVRTVEYLKTPPSLDELKQLHALLSVPVRDMIRDNEPVFAELGLDDASLSDDALLEAVASNPMLLQRPIVVRGARAVIGRPPEKITALFN